MKNKILKAIGWMSRIIIIICYLIFLIRNTLPLLKQFYSMDWDLAPGIETTVHVIQLNALMVLIGCFAILYVIHVILDAIYIASSKSIVICIIKCFIILIVGVITCAFIFNFRADPSYRIINYIVAFLGIAIPAPILLIPLHHTKNELKQ